MKKGFPYYAVIWAILFAVFNAVVFAVRPVTLFGYEVVYGARFWITWALINLCFIGNLACAYYTFRAGSAEKLFYRIPLLRVSYTGLVLMLVFGCAVLLIPDCPAVAALVCVIILLLNSTAVVKAAAGAEAVERVGEKVKEQSQFIRMTTANAQGIMNAAKSDAAKAACKQVHEALRYSDPMSSQELSVDEAMITLKLGDLAAAVGAGDEEKIAALAGEAVTLVKNRNAKCKAMKG